MNRPTRDSSEQRPSAASDGGNDDDEGWFNVDRPDRLAAGAETIAVARKKALLRILARREAGRANLQPTERDIEDMSERFRQGFGLADADALEHWLAASGLGRDGYAAAMRDFAVVRLVEEHFAGEIDELVEEQIAIGTARHRLDSDG